MRTKLLLLVAVLLLVPFVAANAAPFTISGLKKAGEVWLSGDGVFSVEEWNASAFREGAKLTNSDNSKVKSLSIGYDGKDPVHYAIFKKNGRLKQWGEVVFADASEYSFRKLKKKLFKGNEWNWTAKAHEAIPVGNKDVIGKNDDRDDQKDGGDEKADQDGSWDGKKDDKADNDDHWGPYGDIEDGGIDLPGGGQPNGDPKTAPVPEPATMLLLGSGLIGLAGAARKKLKK